MEAHPPHGETIRCNSSSGEPVFVLPVLILAADEPHFLYYSGDVWRFPLLWTLALYAGFHLASGVYAFFMIPSKMSLGIPVVFAIVGGIEATMAGSIVGLM